MTKQKFLEYCHSVHGILPDYPFNGKYQATVLRHEDNRKWYALIMTVSRCKLGLNSDETADIVNLKLPIEMFGSFDASDGVYPAFHMNKLHWVSVILADASDSLIEFLTNVSFDITKSKQSKTVNKYN